MSSGIGRATAKEFVEHGYRVFGGVRNTVPVCWWHNERMPKILYPQVIEEDPHELEKLEKSTIATPTSSNA